MFDILVTCCELDSRRGMRGRVGGTSAAIKRYNVILVSRLSWICTYMTCLPRPGQKANGQNMSNVGSSWAFDLPRREQKGNFFCARYCDVNHCHPNPWTDTVCFPVGSSPPIEKCLCSSSPTIFFAICQTALKAGFPVGPTKINRVMFRTLI